MKIKYEIEINPDELLETTLGLINSFEAIIRRIPSIQQTLKVAEEEVKTHQDKETKNEHK